MKTKKLLSILLALMMMLSVVPMYASAATPIALKVTNVTEWPIATGEIYYGQMVSEGITISGGKVEYNGVEVPGKFIHWKDEFRPTAASDASKASISFVPDDTSAYKGFNKLLSADVTFKVKKATPVLLNEDNPPVATAIKAGETLSLSTLSGGTVKNPWREDLDLSSIAWEWVNPDLVVTESGEYDAKIPLNEDCYEILTKKVYVEVEKDIEVSVIKETPHFDELTYNPNVTFADLILEGGKAVISGTDIEVDGIFTITDYWKQFTPTAGSYEIDGIFTPNNTEEYKGFEFKIPVKVNPAHISFVDGEGNAVVEGFEFEVEPGTKMGDVKALLNTVLRVPANSIIQVEDSNSYAQNGRTYKLTVLYDENSNYTGNELYFTVKFKDVELTPTITAIGLNAFKVNCGDYKPAGTFTITCNGEEVATVKANQDFNCEVWTDNGGSYEIKAKYNPTENDYFIISDAEWAITVYAKRNLNVASAMTYTVNGDAHAKEIRANDIIVAKTSYEDFAHYVIKDGSGKEIVLEGVDLTSKEITFAMPDHDVKISFKTNTQLEQEEAAANCDHICHSDNPLFQMLWKVLTFIFRLFDVQQYCDCGNLHYDAPLFG